MSEQLIRIRVTVANDAAVGDRVLKIINGNAGTTTASLGIFDGQPEAPGVPQNVVATAGNSTVAIAFDGPTDGGPVGYYTVRATDLTNPGNGGQSVTGAESPIVVQGLTNGDRYTFTVTAANTVGESAESTPSVAATPQASSVAATSTYPTVLGQDAFWRWVRLTGSGFDAATTVDLGSGVVVEHVFLTNDTTIILRLSVDPTATIGPRDVIVTAGNGDTGACLACFDVASAPSVSSVSPSTLGRGTTTSVDLIGDHFDAYPVVTVANTGDVSIVSTTRVSAQLIRLEVAVDPAATIGGRTLNVRNGNAGRTTATVAITN